MSFMVLRSCIAWSLGLMVAEVYREVTLHSPAKTSESRGVSDVVRGEAAMGVGKQRRE